MDAERIAIGKWPSDGQQRHHWTAGFVYGGSVLTPAMCSRETVDMFTGKEETKVSIEEKRLEALAVNMALMKKDDIGLFLTAIAVVNAGRLVCCGNARDVRKAWTQLRRK